MKKLLGILAAALLLGSCGMPLLQPTLGPAQESGLNVVVIDGDSTDAALAANPAVNYGSVIVKAVPGFDAARFARLGAEVASTVSFPGIEGEFHRLRVAEGSMVKAINSLRRTRGVLWAEPELVSKRVLPVEKVDAAERLIIDGNLSGDPRGEYSLYSLGITKALDSYKAVASGGNDYGTNNVLMAVIDTGINWTHEDFWTNPDGDDINEPGESVIVYAKSAFNKAVDGTMTWIGDGNAFVQIPEGENWDDEAHGSHVAGTMLALGDNGVGVTGVAWKNARVISYKCFANAESGSGADWSVYGALGDLAAYVEAERIAGRLTQATIPVNMSLGGSYAGSFELEMINYALSQGVLPVVAMGNDGMRMAQFPASYQGVLAVGATNGRDEKVHFSNTGHWISVSAPGYDIVSVGNGGAYWNNPEYGISQTDYQWMSGTSMATPFVTGMVGYLLSFDPTLTPYQVKRVLEITADDKGAAGFDEDFGWGRVNVLAAATMVRTGAGLPADNAWYLNTKIVATVENVNAAYGSGIPGFSERVVGATVSVFDGAGQFLFMGMTNGTDGSVEFRGLPADTYTVTVNYMGEVQTQTVTLDSSADQSAAFSFDKAIVFICTVPNGAFPTSSADTKITVYAADGTTGVVPTFDSGTLDTVQAALASGTYYAKIEYYTGESGPAVGEYGFRIGFTGVESVNVTDGVRAANTADSMEPNNTAAEADAKGAITLDTDYGMSLQVGDVDWYKFVIP